MEQHQGPLATIVLSCKGARRQDKGAKDMVSAIQEFKVQGRRDNVHVTFAGDIRAWKAAIN